MDGPGPGSGIPSYLFSQPNAPMPDGTTNLTPSAQPNPGSSSVAGPTGNGGGISNPNPAFNIAQAISSLSSSASNWTALSSAYINVQKSPGSNLNANAQGVVRANGGLSESVAAVIAAGANSQQPETAPSVFRVPGHKNAHHLHSIPPREKNTRTLIIDYMLWVHGASYTTFLVISWMTFTS
jgi:hypothetical protein